MPRVLLLIPSTTYRTHDFMEAAYKLHLEVVVGSDHRQTLADLAPNTTLALNFQEPELAVAQIQQASAPNPFQAVIGVDDDTVVLATMANAVLGLPHNPLSSVLATRDKYEFRKQLEATDLCSPNFQLISIQEDPSTVAGRISYPCVLKPTFLSGSRGVIRADNTKEFEAAFQEICNILNRPKVAKKGGKSAQSILVEDYIPGDEVAVEGLLVEGRLKILAFFDKPDPLEGPVFAETIYTTPSQLPQKLQQEILRAVQEATHALKLCDGPVHAELRFNAAGVWPVEIAARSIGGLCSRILEFGHGIRLEELLLHHALGRPVDRLEREHQAAGVMMLPVLQQGVLQAVNGQEEARSIPGVKDLTITIPTGQTVEPLPVGNRYLGFLFASSETPQHVEEILREAYQQLEIVISSVA